ncbi:MAG: hypothetical protein M1819_004766 [Sarea resinae]|nr:MAG: hypothetical protein M1819_004766 [Sarea resinae]
MNSAIPRRPAVALLSKSASPSSTTSPSLPSCWKRHESSFRRTKLRLRVKPDPSFASSSLSPQQDHIVFNPPSSAPSVYHTPAKFLPQGDPRRKLFAAVSNGSSSSTNTILPPPVRQPYEKKYHLTEADMEEIRRLRTEDPSVWTREALSKKFNCSNLFVGIVCQATKEHKGQQKEILEAVKAKWGRRRREAREDRVRRREAWQRDE